MTFGNQPEDVVVNSYGAVQAGVVLSLYSTEADAIASINLLTTVTTSALGRWSYTNIAKSIIWIRTPSGDIYATDDANNLDAYVTIAGRYPLGTSENPVTDPAAIRPIGIPVVYWITATQPTYAINGDVVNLPNTDLSASVIRTTVQTTPAFSVADNAATTQSQIKLSDTATHDTFQLYIDHYGNGTADAYAFDIRNRPGAQGAFVIHNYSDVVSPVQIDNTATKTLITLRNTENATLSPGTKGTGGYFQFEGYPGGNTTLPIISKGHLNKDMMFVSLDVAQPFQFFSGIAASALTIYQDGAAAALMITATANAANLYLANFQGQNYGPIFSTATNGGDTLTVSKNATGTGTAISLVNKGTGLSLDVRSATVSLWAVESGGIPQWVAAANQQTTVGAAGGASALPATPVKYLKVKDSAGTTYVIPAYTA